MDGGGGDLVKRGGGGTSWHNLGNYNFVTAWRSTGQNIGLILDFLKREKFFFSKEATLMYSL
mgnify:CR=1 FL=1